MKTDYGIIIFEYDGTYWHDINEDDKKDLLIFQARQDIIGIIRISDTYFKKQNETTIIETINESISKIKNKESKKIRL